MASIKYYKKYTPNTHPVIVINGEHTQIQFTTVDGLLGWYATDNEHVQAKLEEHMHMQRYGISEVSAEEFTKEYLEKKRTRTQEQLRPAWREEISKSAGHTLDRIGLLGEGAARAVAVSGKTDVPLSRREPSMEELQPGQPTQAPGQQQPAKKEEFKPNLGRRQRRQ